MSGTHHVHQHNEPGTSGFEREPQETAQAGGRDLEVFKGLADTAGDGLEDARMEELLTPFLGLLQPLSPQIDPSSPVRMPGAVEGMFLNTATGQLYPGDVGIEIVPCAREYLYGEWTPRDKGGGFHGTRGPDDPEVKKLLATQGRFRKLMTGRGTEFVEQFNVYCWAAQAPIDIDVADQIVLSFTSTKMGVYKRWFNAIGHIKYPYQGRTIIPAMWAHVWRLTSVPQKNDKGRFWNYDIRLARGDNPRDSLILPTEPLFAKGREFSELVRSGRVKADYESAASGAPEPPF